MMGVSALTGHRPVRQRYDTVTPHAYLHNNSNSSLNVRYITGRPSDYFIDNKERISIRCVSRPVLIAELIRDPWQSVRGYLSYHV